MLKPLVITPKPFNDESIRGFILRTSEENGYQHPLWILQYAGLDENEVRSAKPPLDKLVRLYGCKTGDLRHMEYSINANSDKYRKEHMVNGHSIPLLYLQLKKPHICPECIRETGYISMFWDLKYAVVCPTHKKVVIEACPSCGNKLSWNRPGQLICRCGFDYSSRQNSEISDSKVLGLQDIIWRKFHDKPLSGIELTKYKFPVHNLEKMSLSTLFGLIERFSNVQSKEENKPKEVIACEMLSLAAKLFADWPNGLFNYLDRIGQIKHKEVLDTISLKKQFDRFYNAILKSGLPRDEVLFIKDVFLRFGEEHWRKGFLDKRLLTGEDKKESNIVGLNKAAEIIGIRPVTLKRLVKKDLINATIIKNDNQEKFLFDISKPLPSKTNDTLSIPKREVGREIGLPVSVLNSLRREGAFEVRHLGDKVTSFHHKDVEELKKKIEKLVKNVKKIRHLKDEEITIAGAMRMSTGSADSKASIVSEVFTGKIPVIGRVSRKISGIVLHRKAVKQLVRSINLKITKTYSASEAAKILSMDFECVHWLAKNKYLDAVDGKQYLRVSEESVNRFKNEFISCSEIAKNTGSSTRGIVYKCKKYKIKLEYARRKNGRSPQPFVNRSSISKIGA